MSASSSRRPRPRPRLSLRLSLILLFIPAAIVVIVIAACGDPSHIYEGRLFLESRNCVGTPSSIDVVEGDPPTTKCPVRCLTQPHRDGGRAVYVSTMCEPFPFNFDASGNDPACAKAIQAFERLDTCLLDGGSANPAPPPPPPPVDASSTPPSDASSSSDSSDDASSAADAPTD
jgi:hypothetical protein